MRVIERKQPLEIEIICTECYSHLAYVKNDIKTISLIRQNQLHTAEVVKCPICGEFIIIREID